MAIILLTTLLAYQVCSADAASTKQSDKLLLLIFDITSKIQNQGMVYGPL